jgi:glucokinase
VSVRDAVVLAADVGGTNTKIAIARFDEAGLTPLARRVYASRSYAAFEDVVSTFLAEGDVLPFAHELAAGCFAVAGPVERGAARLTNLTWIIDESALARRFLLPQVRVINDFAAVGLAIDHVSPPDLLTLQAGAPVARSHRVVVGAGTGLGVAWLTWNEGRYWVHPSEGGHADFAPVDAIQDELLAYLRGRFGRVSCERILSGRGLKSIFDFLLDRAGAQAGEVFARALQIGDPAGVVADFALANRDALAVQALDIFSSAYGAFAGNMALTALAHGGVYIAGGIAPKISAKLADGTFIRAFTAKGRFSALLQTIPVYVLMNDQVGLLGALAEAARIAQ